MKIKTQYNAGNSARLALILALNFISNSHGQDNFAQFELEREDNWSPLISEDLNGDRLKDLIYSSYSDAAGRELYIHYQQSDGTFQTTPERIEIKREIIGIGFAELRATPGMELVLYATTGVFGLSPSIEGYSDNLRPLVQWDLVANIPDKKTVEFLPPLNDIDGDNKIDMLIPGSEGYGLFSSTSIDLDKNSFVLKDIINPVNDNLISARRNNRGAELDGRLSINAREGIVVDVAVEKSHPFDNFLTTWPRTISTDGLPKENKPLLENESWIPNIIIGNFDNSVGNELAYVNLDDEARPQLNLRLIQKQKSIEHFHWVGSLPDGGDSTFVDLDLDGLLDMIFLQGGGNSWEAKLYRNRGGGFDFKNPDQVMRFSGYDVRLNVFPTPVGDPALNVSYYTIPVVEAIRNASVTRVNLIYKNNAGDDLLLFERKPISRQEENFGVENIRGLAEQLTLAYDVDGDGKNDAAYITENGTLAAKKVQSDLSIAREPFWEYILPKTVFEFKVLMLNDDDVPDLILRHGTSTTVLVSRP